MNVLFHTAAAIGTVALAVKPKSIKSYFDSSSLKTGFGVFAIGIITHGVLDFLPHCYPIPTKIDAIASFVIMIFSVLLVKNKFRFIVGMAFLGCVFPDLIDLAPSIINKYASLNFPELDAVFPFHKHELSGSIYNEDCTFSKLYQVLLIALVYYIGYRKRRKLIALFRSF